MRAKLLTKRYARIVSFTTGLVLYAGLYSGSAFAQLSSPFASASKSSNDPIGISANSIEADIQNQSATYVGNVVVSQGELKLRSDTLTIKTNKGEINRIQAKGNVVLANRDATASGGDAIYDVGGKTVVLSGRVVLTQGQNVLKGTRLVVNLQSGEAKLTASDTGGRVEGLFPAAKTPKSPKAPPAKPTAAPAKPATVAVPPTAGQTPP